MLRKRSRRKSVNRKNISLIFVCFAIVIGIIGGLSSNMAQSDTSRRNPTFLENSGSMSKTSDASVEVYSDETEEDSNINSGTDHPGKPGNNGSHNAGHSHNNGSGGSTGTAGSSSANKGPENMSVESANNGDDTPSVIVDDYGKNSFPQTGEAKDHLSLLGMMMLSTMIYIYGFKAKNNFFNTKAGSKL